MQVDWTSVIISVIGLVLTSVLIPFIKSKLTKEQLEKIDYWVRYFIVSAEQNIKGEKVGDKRKEHVMSQLRALKLVTDKNEVQVSDLIDGICKELTNQCLINTGE